MIEFSFELIVGYMLYTRIDMFVKYVTTVRNNSVTNVMLVSVRNKYVN